MSHRHTFETPEEIQSNHYNLVGYVGDLMYAVSVNSQPISTFITFWSVHTMVQKSWEEVCRMRVSSPLEIFSSGLTSNGATLYALFINMEHNDNRPLCTVLKLDTVSRKERIYTLDQSEESRNEFEKVEVNDVGVVCGVEDVYLVDRNVTRGILTYTKLIFDDETETFRVEHYTIPNDGRAVRFPIHYDVDKKRVLRYTSTSDFIVYNEHTNNWDTYTEASTNTLNAAVFPHNGVTETYSVLRAKCMAISSPLKMFGREGKCFACVYDSETRQDSFYRFTLNETDKTHSFTFVGKFYRPVTTFQFRLETNGTHIARLSKNFVEFLRVEVPTLREIAVWGIQKKFGTTNAVGHWTGGITEKEIKKAFKFSPKMVLF